MKPGRASSETRVACSQSLAPHLRCTSRCSRQGPNRVPEWRLNSVPRQELRSRAAQGSRWPIAARRLSRQTLARSARISPHRPEIAIHCSPAPVAAATSIPIMERTLATFEIMAFLVSPSAIAANVGATRVIRMAHIPPSHPMIAPPATYLVPYNVVKAFPPSVMNPMDPIAAAMQTA